MANVYGIIRGTLSAPGVLSGKLSGVRPISGSLSVPSVGYVTRYEGPYEFTPTSETQTVQIENELATSNITINPIPSNYGLITWDGATLLVS